MIMQTHIIWLRVHFLRGFRTTRPGTPATSRKHTACVRAVCSDAPAGRASSTAALRSTLRRSSWRERAPASLDGTPTPRFTSPSRWAAPACRWWRRSGAGKEGTTAWRERGPEPGVSLGPRYDRSRGTLTGSRSWHLNVLIPSSCEDPPSIKWDDVVFSRTPTEANKDSVASVSGLVCLICLWSLDKLDLRSLV